MPDATEKDFFFGIQKRNGVNMNTENQLNEEVEKYLEGGMKGEELMQFENRLAQDPDLLEYVISFEALTGAIRMVGRRNKIKEQLNKIHDNLLLSATLPESKIVSIWRNNYKILMVAAVVALVSIISTLSIVNQWYLGKKQNVKYTELRREIDWLKRKQNAMLKKLPAGAVTTPYNPGKYSGTGFVISSEGYLITSFHVIKDADYILIENTFHSYKAKVVFKEKEHDLAILKITDSTFANFTALPFLFKPKDALLGESVYTLGYPREDIVYGEGSVSSKTGYEGDSASYQVSIPVNPGNSGGPLFDQNGYLIGMISGKQTEMEAAAFALKSNYLKNKIDSVAQGNGFNAINRKNLLFGFPRPQQIKKLEEFIFNVKVYN
jgi:serine protease Do